MADETFSAGDTVRLNSGGPLMTVESVDDNRCKCTWFDDKNKLQTASFAAPLLGKDDGSVGIL